MGYQSPTAPAGRKRGRPVGANSEQTRRTILEAARDIIAERGYQATTFQHIAQRAGVSRPTLHYYFATREALYDRLLCDVGAVVDEAAHSALGRDSLRGQLAAFAAELSRLGADQPEMMKLVVTARIDHHRAAHRHEAATAIVSKVHAFYDAVALDADRRGELAPGVAPQPVADMLAALFWGLGFHAGFLASGPDVPGAPEVARQLLFVLNSGLLSRQVDAPVSA